MARMAIFAAVLMAAAIAGTSAHGLASNNLAYLSPIAQFPELARAEPASVYAAAAAVSSRKLLGGRALQAPASWAAPTSAEVDAVFQQDVASGDPLADAVIIWARVSPVENVTAATVDWAISTSPTMATILQEGSVITSPEVDFTVKVDVQSLSPATIYYYRFYYDGVLSNIGRTKTIPSADADIEEYRFAIASCSNFPVAFFNAYGIMAEQAQRDQVDVLLHLGDYLYETRATGSANLATPEYRAERTVRPAKEMVTLDEYRTRWNQYNTDFNLKFLRRSMPMIAVWDDHEFTNNIWKAGGQNHQPATEGDFFVRRAVALQVYYEQIPIRQVQADLKLRIYRKFQIGKLIDLIMLDTRAIGREEQNRTNAFLPSQTLLGAEQKAWFFDQLDAAEARGATWKFIGQQVLFAKQCPADPAAFSDDSWDGYQLERLDILNKLESEDIKNMVVLSGDIHRTWIGDVPKIPCGENATYTPSTGAGSLAVEMGSDSITSGWNPTATNRNNTARTEATNLRLNPHLKYTDNFYKGYTHITVTKTEATATYINALELSVSNVYDHFTSSWLTKLDANHIEPATCTLPGSRFTVLQTPVTGLTASAACATVGGKFGGVEVNTRSDAVATIKACVGTSGLPGAPQPIVWVNTFPNFVTGGLCAAFNAATAKGAGVINKYAADKSLCDKPYPVLCTIA